ncbi:TIGR00303 family protein [Sulfurovum sp. bin170]|uniref:nicotinate mononucleotide-dependent phosphoribosyltransferase CobT n=1 Tax=Sulfurovum sp. bin170 TaxID=2695268 RepID=UPI0013DF7711|nr:TIGR00303 family protein [Sulfurovum sp. bin170]NEW60156.1 TIGR00303 family protein [Sulfurovum sp. bin170]
MIKTIIGKPDFIESLRGKRASFMLALSNTKTADIEGITQAGIRNMIYLTPTLDSEFLCTGEVRSLENIAQTPKGVPTPALITRAVHLLAPYGRIELLDLGLEIKPKLDYFTQHGFDITPSQSIVEGADIDAQEVFEKGVAFGQSYECQDEYIILAESVPSGTTTATATALGLGYKAEGMFSSSFKNSPDDIKEKTLKLALSNIDDKNDIFDTLSKVSDNMIIFNAGFLMGLNNRIKVILAGGTQMACVLLVMNRILKLMGGAMETSNLALCTTKWVAEDENSDIEALLKMLSFPINAYYADFDFSLSERPALKLYDEGEAKEGVGAGGALVYGFLNGVSKDKITKQVESQL